MAIQGVAAGGRATRNVARTCRHFGISRQAFYGGSGGSTRRARRVVRSAQHAASVAAATPAEVVSKILYLRQTYHFGPGKIADYLKRFHQRLWPCRRCTAFWRGTA